LYKLLRLDAEKNLTAQIAQLKAKLHMYSEKDAIDRLISLYAELMYYPDPMKKWANTMSAQLDFDRYHPDLVMSHSFPHSSHVLASRLKRNGIPWIASFSDLWTDSHFYPYSRFRKRRETRLEEETLRGCKCFITVSSKLSEVIEDKYCRHAFTIQNGYPVFPDVPLTKEFTVTYTGNFYPQRYEIESFCWALANYKYKFPNLKVRILGHMYPALVRMVHDYCIEDVVEFKGNVSHAESLKAQKESHVLLHFAWNDPAYQGVYSAKLMEYLGAKRPIISFGGADEEVGKLLFETGAGRWVRTPEGFADALSEMYGEYKTNGLSSCRSNGEVEKYSAVKMAEAHAHLFDRMAR
jgi:glycosyltransferase involved in cell wall biosynthesis